MNKKHIEAMNAAGLDTSRYFSLRIDRSQFPEGSEVVIQIRDQGGNLHNVKVSDTVLDGYFGKHSRFYAQVMADGHVFNPYIHRRFLPSQFRRNIRYAGHGGIRDYVRTSYGWNYVVRFLSEECWKLAILERRDREAFLERSRFFPLPDMKSILSEYLDVVVAALDEAVKSPHSYNSFGQKYTYYVAKDIQGIGNIRKDHMRPMRYRFVKARDSINACRSYAQLAAFLDGFDFARLNNNLPVSSTFVNRFLESGAFYTLKHAIMFENLNLGGNDVEENLAILANTPQRALLSLYCQHDK